MSKLQEKPSTLKKEHLALPKHENSLLSSILQLKVMWIHADPDADPGPQPSRCTVSLSQGGGSVFIVFGSGSSIYIRTFLSKHSVKRFAVEDEKLSM